MSTLEEIKCEMEAVTKKIARLCNSYEADTLSSRQLLGLNDSLQHLDSARHCLMEEK